MTAYPDVVVHELGDDDEFLVIACDGKLITPILRLTPLLLFFILFFLFKSTASGEPGRLI